MIVVNKKNQDRTIDLIDFYEIKGLINTYGLVFDWRKDHGIIIGPDYTKIINSKFNQTKNFENFTILRKWSYDHEECTTKYLNPLLWSSLESYDTKSIGSYLQAL